MRGVATLAIVLGLVAGLTACGSGGEAEPSATGATTTAAAAHATIIPGTAATVVEQTETPVATADSKYDEAWARKQVEPIEEEGFEIMLAHNWSKAYDLYSDEERAGCSRATFVSKTAGIMLVASAFGINDDFFKAKLQDLKDGKLVITFSEITKDRITYTTLGSSKPTAIVREKGKWVAELEPLGENCASLDINFGQTPTPEP